MQATGNPANHSEEKLVEPPLPPSAPADPAVAKALADAIAAREVAGGICIVSGKEGVISVTVAGAADRATEKPIAEDTMFWIASMTKPITASAVMMLTERGEFSLDDPVAMYLPEFSELRDEADNPVRITVRQCLMHVTGLAEVGGAETVGIQSLEKLMPLIAAKPVAFKPGSEWRYCQSSIQVAARIVEVVSGTSFPEYLQGRLFDPLEMKDTTFAPTDAQWKRIATAYARTGEGVDAKLEAAGEQMKSLRASSEGYPRASGGLYGTARDYERFARMILRGGEYEGVRYLSEASVKAMVTPQTGDLEVGFTPGNAWGIGWCVVAKPQGPTAGLHPESFGHGGAWGTQAWIDPVAERVQLLMVQRTNFPNSDASPLREAFHLAVRGGAAED